MDKREMDPNTEIKLAQIDHEYHDYDEGAAEISFGYVSHNLSHNFYISFTEFKYI